jgi:AcrR family transcriptional regulator
MPRVSEEHLERRRQQILDAARRCFIRKGVHATSMQDIFAEADLSAGAVYRYFKSKNEIIGAIVSGVLGNMRPFLSDLVHSDPILPLDEIVQQMTRRMTTASTADGVLRLGPQTWGLATHDPELRSFVQQQLTSLRGLWIEYARRCVDAGLLPPGTDPEATGKTLFCLLPGFLLQKLIIEDVESEDLVAGVRALSKTALTGQTPTSA